LGPLASFSHRDGGGRHALNQQHVDGGHGFETSFGFDDGRVLVDLTKYAKRVRRATIGQSVAHYNTVTDVEWQHHQLLGR